MTNTIFRIRMRIYSTLAALLMLISTAPKAEAAWKALIVDGQNNHGMWPKTTAMMKHYLEETRLFEVDIARTAFTWQGDDLVTAYPLPDGRKTVALKEAKSDPDFKPDFSKYNLVVINFGWGAAPWPTETRVAFEKFVSNGGGVVVVHAADNSFPEWPAYNSMIGLGGWGDRDEKSGPYVYYNDEGNLVRDPSPGRGGSHGAQHEFQIRIRNADHPITRGMPPVWLHAQDELYDRLRGPAENMEVLATTFSDKSKNGTGRHEPMLITVKYRNGRVFHTPMGHADYSVECVGFRVCFARGAEWAVSGTVTQESIPEDFPTPDKASRRPFRK